MLNTKHLTQTFSVNVWIIQIFTLSLYCQVQTNINHLTTTNMEATKKTFAPFSYTIKPETLQAYSKIIDLDAYEWTRELYSSSVEFQEDIHVEFDGETITAHVNSSHLFDRTSDYATIADLWVCSIVAGVLEEDCSKDLICSTSDLDSDGWFVDWNDPENTLKYSLHSGGRPARVQLWATPKNIESFEVCKSLSDFGGLDEFHKFVLKYA